MSVDTGESCPLEFDPRGQGRGTDDIVLLTRVFADLAYVMFCVKDVGGRYLAANDAFIRRTGRRSARSVIGRRAADLFPADLAASYEAQDRAVFSSGQPVRFQLEVITNVEGVEEWFLTNKMLVGVHAATAVLAVISSAAHLPRPASLNARQRPPGLRAAIDHARLHFAGPLRVDALAEMAGMSLSQFERSMHRALGVSPKQFLLGLRRDHAATLLVTTTLPIAAIATACGYYDQSQFTRLFRTATGVTPGAYRANASSVDR
jgi:AraC-like DNA-binding protein